MTICMSNWLRIKKLKARFSARNRFQERDEAALFRDLYLSGIARPRTADACGIIFSMDRAIQLHALLTSYFEKVKDQAPIMVLYRASDERHGAAYQEVFAEFAGRSVTPVRQVSRSTFRSQFFGILESLSCESIFFLVDDILFIEDFDLADVLKFDTRDFVPSMRLGDHLTRCYTMNQVQRLPDFFDGIVADPDKRVWKWSEGEFDWAYPLSVDGHVFSRVEFLIFAKHAEFSSPNTLEGSLQRFNKYFSRRWGVCYRKGRIVNNPCNKVQDDNQNLHGDAHQNQLLERWEAGFKIDPSALYGVRNIACHQEFEFRFVRRK